tara:strand:+ start:187 stop:1218 length:1032 start_codon:yes stop_codon:yes gene_type:complete
MINNIFIKYSSNIKQAIKKLNNTKSKALIVIDTKNNYLGTITDGDIRRAIVKNFRLNDSIKLIYKKKSFFLKKNYSAEVLRKMIRKKELRIIPILDNQNKVIQVLDLSNKKFSQNYSSVSNKNIQVIIMAGGVGKRMQPYTHVIPKPLLPIQKKPMIEHVIDFFRINGLKSFVISINYKSDLLKTYFNNLKNYKDIKFIEEKRSLGTIGSLSLINNKKTKNFIVSNCDMKFSFPLKDLIDTHSKNKNDATIVVSLKEDTVPYGVFVTDNDGNIIKMSEKPKISNIINVGLYIFNNKVVNLVKKNKHTDVNELIKKIINHKKFKVELYPVSENSWTDMSLKYRE